MWTDGREATIQWQGRFLTLSALPHLLRLLSQERKHMEKEMQINDPTPWCGEMSEISLGFEALTFVIYKIKSFFIDRLKELHILRIYTTSGTVLGDV